MPSIKKRRWETAGQIAKMIDDIDIKEENPKEPKLQAVSSSLKTEVKKVYKANNVEGLRK